MDHQDDELDRLFEEVAQEAEKELPGGANCVVTDMSGGRARPASLVYGVDQFRAAYAKPVKRLLVQLAIALRGSPAPPRSARPATGAVHLLLGLIQV